MVNAIEPQVVTKRQVKDEAQRRIYVVAPQHVQANMTARGVELLHKGQANWSADDAAEATAGFAMFDAIKLVRSKSNEIEVMNPIPTDFTDDKYW